MSIRVGIPILVAEWCLIGPLLYGLVWVFGGVVMIGARMSVDGLLQEQSS